MIVDSSALVAILTGEERAEALTRAVAAADAVIVPSSCYLETGMVLGGRSGEPGVAMLDQYLVSIEARVLPFTEAHARGAVEAFLRYGTGRHPAGLNFGDCMAYAVAQAERAPLLFVGEDFARTDTSRWDG